MYLRNCLPLRDSPITAVTKRIVRIFDVMAEREKTLSGPLPKGRKGFYFTSSPTLTTLPPFFFMSSPSCSSLPSLFVLRATPVCLFRGSRAWMSYQSFPGLWLNCEEATVSPTLCYQPHGSHNEANMHTPASTFTQIHRELKEHAHVHTCTHTGLSTINKSLVQTGVIFTHSSGSLDMIVKMLYINCWAQ